MKRVCMNTIVAAFCCIIGILKFNVVSANPGVIITSTYVLDKTQFPSPLKKFSPSSIYVIYKGRHYGGQPKKTFQRDLIFRGDTIINLKKLLDSQEGTADYRLLFASKAKVDSVWQTDQEYRITDKAYPVADGLLKILVYDTSAKITDEFIYNYAQKYREEEKPVPDLKTLLRSDVVYTRTDRNKYAAGTAWVLSIGIDRYASHDVPPLRTCESDARAYEQFFKTRFGIFPDGSRTYHGYVLTGKQATKANILKTLKEIAAGASSNDYFVFNFNGMSIMMTFDSVTYSTYFIPYDSVGYTNDFIGEKTRSRDEINNRLLSLKVLQEHIQLISARNQLIISEAGPSEKFKTEFIKTMMQNSPATAALLNVNRVIMVPNKVGLDGFRCGEKFILMAPITHAITTLDSTYNIYDLFGSPSISSQIASQLKSSAYNCKFMKDEYFDVFFEREFLQQYMEIFGDEINQTRGGITVNKEVQKIAALNGKRHALVIGTDHYKGKGWDKLGNPVYDATEIADILKGYYDYEVQLLKDPPMDSIYKAIREYYRTLQPDDKLIIYVAGHGDYDKDLLDDGFIVCTDSRSVEDDPLRNSYIQHTKLKKMINKIPAKQILVLLDICHGGVFDEQVRDNPGSRIVNRNVLELLRTNSQYTIRKMLSSVGLESAFDGKAGKHSPFASYLINALLAKGGQQGIITLADIFVLLQKASLNETATLKTSPYVAGFGDNNPLGDFILIPIEAADKKKEESPKPLR